MEQCIKTHDILNLINKFVVGVQNSLIINSDNTNLIESIKEKRINTYLANIYENNNIISFIREIDLKDILIDLFIFFPTPTISFSNMLNLAKILSDKDVEYVILTKRNKKDTKNVRAFLVYYEPYRTVGNALLLRRFHI